MALSSGERERDDVNLLSRLWNRLLHKRKIFTVSARDLGVGELASWIQNSDWCTSKVGSVNVPITLSLTVYRKDMTIPMNEHSTRD